MTNFILNRPRVILIHLPKTGSRAVRTALATQSEGHFFGHIPQRYADLARVAVVRNPEARFIATVNSFRNGGSHGVAGQGPPRWPGLTIAQALDVLEDPWVGYDRSDRNRDWALKHQLLPQTHPFNCLAEAQWILRHETLAQDFERFCAQFELSTTLPEPQAPPEAAPWCAQDRERFERIFVQDHELLGYNAQTGTAHAVPRLPPSERAVASVFNQWSAYFGDQKRLHNDGGAALPAPDCALEPFIDEVIPGARQGTWAGRSKNMLVHFHKLQPEFAGACRLSHLLACTIVVLRREPACEPALTLFWRILDEEFEIIRAELSLRWLVAISDTIVDFGRNPAETAVGLSASIYANTTKLHESELTVFYPNRPWPPRKRLSRGGSLFDGLLSFWTEKGDMIHNMLERSTRTAALSPTAGQVLLEVMERLQNGPTVLRRFARLSGLEIPPLLEEGVKRRLNRVMKKHL